MSKLFTSIIVFLGMFTLLALPAPASAVDVLDPVCKAGGSMPNAEVCQDRGGGSPQTRIFGPDGVLTKVANFIIMVVGVASVIMIMVGGFKYITASGDPTSIKSAKDTILFAIVGILVAVFGEAIVLFVLNRL